MSGDRPSEEPGKPWTLGAIRRMNLQLEAVCQTSGCGWFAGFDIDKLISELGADYALPPKGANLTCGKCGAPVEFRLAYLHPDQDDPDQA